ncbi:Winged helix DNA-binding protein [Glarea lozoyensis ATCC 20868]|uniref:COP9 signalosome complex subunit 1 n=1 Tax=Glarea lozoyensis (strain ATCC 20868 / MF5171) TaxID=1116229 RepID=S3DW00_GLAL2|nr:Winged helix DNA-binding protein [Glarea lozoyensis ATCC 20868]EPE36131.1 Winged helix DNA-binding protein [Glarea lozoyensis ATCC 20868]
MASLQSAPSSPTQPRNKKGGFIVAEPPKFDLESYIQNYQGRTRLDRLIYIGVCSTFLGVEALKLAVREAKAGKDIRKYFEAQAHLETIGPEEPEAVRDKSWIDRVSKQNDAETKRLEEELKGYKNNLVKESIRMGNEDLGKHYHAIGELPKAFEAFSRMRQDISASKQIIDVSRHLINVAAEQKNWIAINSNVQKVKSAIAGTAEEASVQPYLHAVQGLAHFDVGDYSEAANSFLWTEPGLAQSAATIISPNDVAVYGGLCALATMDRNQLQRRVLENSSFRTYLEMEPQIRRAISFFINSRYTNCLQVLESYRADYLLDIYLHRHIDEIYQLIRGKCIVQYFIPFSSVTLASLNSGFAPLGKTMDKELIAMIQRGDLDARINTVDGLLESRKVDPRAELQREALRMAEDYEKEAGRRILHMHISMAGIEVKSPKRSHGGQADAAFFQDEGHRLGGGPGNRGLQY